MGIYAPGRPTKYDPSSGAGTKPPPAPGEYRIREKAGQILYVGETNNINRRMKEHIRTGKLNENRTIEYQCADGRSTSNTRRVHERAKIEQHNPALNNSAGGEGRPAHR